MQGCVYFGEVMIGSRICRRGETENPGTEDGVVSDRTIRGDGIDVSESGRYEF